MRPSKFLDCVKLGISNFAVVTDVAWTATSIRKYSALWCHWVLHFAWVTDGTKCIVVTHICLSLATFTRYCTDPDVTWGMVGVLPSCALFGRFAIGARVSLLWQHSAAQICSWCIWQHSSEYSECSCTRSMPVIIFKKIYSLIFHSQGIGNW